MAINKRVAKNINYGKYRKSSGDIISSRLKVAQFQRNYVWSGKHIGSLIQSIEDNSRGYYIGNIIIQRCNSGSAGSDLIVDGQQRLTTLSLIVRALRDELSDDAKLFQKTQEILFVKNYEPFISFSRKNLNLVYKKILMGVEIEKKDESQKQFLKSYEFIKKRIKKIENIKEFFIKLLYVEFVVIKCPTEHDVHQLFESLNSKGKKLSSVQLTKNTLLSYAESKESDYLKINSSWEKIERLFEDSKIIWFDKFFRHQWFSIGGYISESALFEKTKKRIKDIGAVNYTKILEQDSQIYTSLRLGNVSKLNIRNGMSASAYRKVDFIISNISKFKSDQIYAVILALIKYGNNHKHYFERDSLFLDLERLWCYLLLLKYSKNISPSSYENVFADFCFKINNPGKQTVKNIKIDFFSKISTKIPSSEDFIKLINDSIYYSGKKDDNIYFNNDRDIVRSLISYYLTDGDNMLSDDSDNTEHIIPKGILSNWHNILPDYIEDVEKNRYKLGNLTLLNKKINEKIENFNFDLKYENAYKGSRYDKNKDLNRYASEFNSSNPSIAVLERGKIIAQSIYNVCLSKLNFK